MCAYLCFIPEAENLNQERVLQFIKVCENKYQSVVVVGQIHGPWSNFYSEKPTTTTNN